MKSTYLVLGAMLVAGAAQAQEVGYEKDALAYSAMMDGDWGKAERHLGASADSLLDDPARLLNLAQVYALTGREAEANDIYSRVLAGDDMVLILSDDRKVTAHMIASTKLATVQQASR